MPQPAAVGTVSRRGLRPCRTWPTPRHTRLPGAVAFVAAATFLLSALGSTALPAAADGGSFRPSHQLPLPWWDASYQYARILTVTTGPTPPLNRYAGYSAQVIFDTSDPARFRSDCNDLRVVYWNGSAYLELNRDVYACGTASTSVWFRLQADIPDSTSDSNYLIYYGNPAAGSPPSDRSQVYLWWDDFSTNPFAVGSPRYTRTKAVDVHGDTYVAPTYDGANQRVAFNTGDNYTSDMYVNTSALSNGEQDVFLQVDHFADLNYPTDATDTLVMRVSALTTSSTHEYIHFSHGSYAVSPGCSIDSWTNGERNNLCGGIVPPVYWPFNTSETWAMAATGTAVRFWRGPGTLYGSPDPSGRTLLLSGTLSPAQPGYVGLAPAQSRGWWDNLLIRRYTEPEPTVALGVEHPYSLPLISATKVDSLFADNDGNGRPSPGDELQYLITLSNSGGSAVASARFDDTPDPNTSLINGSVSATAGTITSGNNPGDISVRVDFGLFLPGDTALISFRVLVDDPVPPGVDEVSNQGALSGSNIPAAPTDDPATAAPDDPTVTNIERLAPELPLTGFAPGRRAIPPAAPLLALEPMADLLLEIPSLEVQVAIVGVPLGGGGWDTRWLTGQAGYLEGTAFPTWPGNSGITAHTYLADGSPGPFRDLGNLQWGDEIIIHGFGARYVYQVREVRITRPWNLSVLGHEELSWLTLITCQGYDEARQAYRSRLVVRAVLIDIQPEE